MNTSKMNKAALLTVIADLVGEERAQEVADLKVGGIRNELRNILSDQASANQKEADDQATAEVAGNWEERECYATGTTLFLLAQAFETAAKSEGIYTQMLAAAVSAGDQETFEKACKAIEADIRGNVGGIAASLNAPRADDGEGYIIPATWRSAKSGVNRAFKLDVPLVEDGLHGEKARGWNAVRKECQEKAKADSEKSKKQEAKNNELPPELDMAAKRFASLHTQIGLTLDNVVNDGNLEYEEANAKLVLIANNIERALNEAVTMDHIADWLAAAGKGVAAEAPADLDQASEA